MPRRKDSRRRVPRDFAAISLGERTKWSVYGPYIQGEGVLEPGSPTLVWPSWELWAEVYGACREDFLAWRPISRVPDS